MPRDASGGFGTFEMSSKRPPFQGKLSDLTILSQISGKSCETWRLLVEDVL